MPEHNIKLYYFPMRGRAETARLLLVYSGVKFDDVKITMEQWPKFKEQMPLGQMPVLEVDGKQVAQSTAIARYIAREHGLAGSNNWDMARADMIVEGLFDMWGHLKDIYVPKLQGDQKTADENWAKFASTQLVSFLQRYEKFLKENGGQWLVGNAITWADIAVAEFLSVLQDCFNAQALESSPTLKSFKEKIFALPQLKEYINTRPATLL